jgi:hypothetical protein
MPREEIERLRLENSKLSEELLELQNSLRFHNGLAGQMQQQHVRIEQIKVLLIRAADALENSPRGTHFELVQELRNAGQFENALSEVQGCPT